MASEVPLETEQTASDGRFLVRYQGPAHSHPDQARIDIRVRAYDGKMLIASSDLICNPRYDLTLTLVRNDEELRGPTEFAAFIAGIDPQLDTVEYKDIDADQVYYLSCKTGFSEETIATIARSYRLKDAYAIDAEVFYGIAHAGFPLSTNAVLSMDADTVESALRKAIEDNAISASVEADIPTILTTLAAARLDRTVPAVNPETTTLGAVLTAASLAAGVPRAFAEKYLSHTGTVSEFWAALRADQNFGDAVVDTIQFTIEVATLSGSYAPLVKLLNQKRELAVFSRSIELAQYDDQDWIDFLGEQIDGTEVSTPAGIPGNDEAERRSNYGRAISRMVEDLYPSAHLAYHLPQGVTTGDVVGFIIGNPTFSLLRTIIDDFLPTASGLPPDPADVEVLRQDLLKIQRVIKITPRYQRTSTAGKLLEAGIASAHQIRMMGASAFMAQHADELGGESTAAYIYDKADQVTATVLTAVSLIRPEFYRPAMNVFTTPGCGDPDLESIFGSLDYCECRHCDSVYGPAAYFVDMMNFLRPAIGKVKGIDAIVARRPELMQIKLNCKNAETPLPTLDMVNEVLERAVLIHKGFNPHPVLSTWPQTTWDPADLLAHPEKVYTTVYDTYLSDPAEACFPSSLPFDLGLEEARIYLTHLGIRRVSLQDSFEWFEAGGNESEAYRVDERLGLSPAQAGVVRGAGASLTPWLCWGFDAEAGWISQINSVEIFLERSELSFPELQALLRTQILDDTEVVYAEPCRLKDAKLRLIADSEVDGIDEAKMRKLVVFLRVQRSLGWSIADLDSVLRGLNLSLDAPVTADLDRLSQFVRVRASFSRLPLREVLAWWAPLETRAPTDDALSFYEETVRPNTRESEFTVAEIDGNVSTLEGFKGSLLAVLQLDETGLDAAYLAAGLDASVDPLNLVNLSKLYRTSSLARALSLSVDELATVMNYSAALKDGNPGPFDGAANAPIRELLEVAQTVGSSTFSVGELDYILRNKSPERFGATHADVTRDLLELIVALQGADADFKASLPLSDLPTEEQVVLLLARLRDGDDLANSLGFIAKTYPNVDPSDEDRKAAFNAYFDFLEGGSPASVELLTPFLLADSPEERMKKLLPELIDHMRLLARERAVVQKLSTLLDLEPADVDA
ncbi:MAG TPA: hypothetical protein ENJ18_18720, partial [Nannocystis exedens]|nr:hypothetical protein [Nannocystis exedens]